jgi:hypothetical protein
MNQSKAEAIVAQLLNNAADVRYGSVSVSAKLHDGRVVEVSFVKIEQTREYETQKALRFQLFVFFVIWGLNGISVKR